MILVDTSVWIEFFRSSSDLDLESVLDLDEVVTCLPIIQEVLQGFDDERAYRLAREAMTAGRSAEVKRQLARGRLSGPDEIVRYMEAGLNPPPSRTTSRSSCRSSL